MIAEGTSLAGHWSMLDGQKGDLLDRCEQYARWTVPSIFPTDDNARTDNPEESEKGNVAIGARLVNHLSHRIVDTMFPNDKPFFAVTLTPEAKRKFFAEAAQEDKDALDEGLIEAENAAMRKLNLTSYRPVAVNAVSLQIVTGNALIYRMPDDNRVVYSIRDYCVSREISGRVREVILRDCKTFGMLDEDMQLAVEAAVTHKGKKYKPEDKIELYTYYWWEGGKWQMRQAVDEVEIEEAKTSYKEADFPCLVLTWNLGRGDHYGRGLVEDYSVSFHNIDVMTEAMIDLIGVAADIKFLVNDMSSFDVDAWNNAKRGEYVPGKEGDISVPQYKFAVEVQFIGEAIAKLERELAQAFLLSSAGVRDAERVTAEEIRFFAREIESAFGGLYSRLALDWQRKEAEYLLSQIGFDQYLPGGAQTFETSVVTGLESLSREGKLDALRIAIADLQMLDAVPQEIRQAFNPLKFASFIFRNRGVEAEDFLFTQDEMKANQEAAMQQEERLMQKQGEVAVATKAASGK
ncbi:head-tail adaptor [Paracoccus phage ParKuw1]|uniref:Head-tail adaptor n=1 Tax=Paracoccus phage ParKuw1 TaxID=3032415 RepID=A0AAF0FNM0_9CAUD|nr:head-tail adaptor [Paracoccus phage ParKuw1]